MQYHKLLYFILIISLQVQGCFALESAEENNMSILQGFYEGKSSFKNSDDYKIYFNAFPSNFDDFVDIMGYRNFDAFVAGENNYSKYSTVKHSTVYGPLYDNPMFYVETFFKTANYIDRKHFNKKVIELTKDGFHQVDAVSVLKHFALKDIRSHMESYIPYILEMEPREIQSWLQFMGYNGCCGIRDPLKEITKALCNSNSELCDIYNFSSLLQGDVKR